jgi:hypothetical protein
MLNSAYTRAFQHRQQLYVDCKPVTDLEFAEHMWPDDPHQQLVFLLTRLNENQNLPS